MLWFDGFECYNAAIQLAFDYSTVGGSPTFTANGRNGGRCIEFTGWGAADYLVRSLGGSLTEVFCQGAWTCNQSDVGQAISYFQLQNASGSPILTIERAGSGVIQVRRGDFISGTLLGSSTATVGLTYKVIECKIVIHASTGSVDVLIDGTPEIALTNQNTEGASGGATKIRMAVASGFNTGKIRLDDLVIHNLGSFIGDQQAIRIDPDGTLANTFGTLVGAATAHEALDDGQPDDDTSYIESDTDAEAARLSLAAHGQSGVGVTAIASKFCVRQPTAGSSQVKVGFQHTSVKEESAAQAVTTAYAFHTHVLLDKPGGSGLVLADLDDLELTIEHELP